ncbi:MAG: hypothetical protein ACRD4B_09950, partial [Acidobacteriota bacterium]
IEYIKDKKNVYRSTLLTEFYRDIDAGTLTTVEGTLQQMKVIKIHHSLDEMDVKYEYIGR